MAKNIILNTVSTDFIQSVSAFNVARAEISRLAAIRRKENEKADKLAEEVRKNRKTAIDGGMSVDDATAKFPMTEADKIRNAAEEAYNKAVEPHQTAKKEAFKAVSDGVYYAYCLTIQKGNMEAKGVLTLKMGKSTVEYKVDKTFKQEIKSFLSEIGAGMTENETALNKCAEALKTWTAGAVNDNKTGGSTLLKAKGKNMFREQFLRAFIQYGVSRNYLVINDDNTVTVRQFEKKEEVKAN